MKTRNQDDKRGKKDNDFFLLTSEHYHPGRRSISSWVQDPINYLGSPITIEVITIFICLTSEKGLSRSVVRYRITHRQRQKMKTRDQDDKRRERFLVRER
jgi:hypothetical protein